jgi:UDP-4-amino-4,6-dideoxy-N-acetyl-beta-L-altrosamine N-acetyltransferase
MNDTEARKLELIPIVELDGEAQLAIRNIRNEDGIRAVMYTDHVIGVDEHLQWIAALRQDKRQIVFGIIDPELGPLGVASVNAIDVRHRKSDWAFYLTQTERGGLGSAIELTMIDFVFDRLGLEKLNCEVIEGNYAVVRLHKKFFFEEEGFRKSNLIKDGRRIGVHFLGLEKASWLRNRAAVVEKYQSSFARFDISIRWPPLNGLDFAV